MLKTLIRRFESFEFEMYNNVMITLHIEGETHFRFTIEFWYVNEWVLSTAHFHSIETHLMKKKWLRICGWNLKTREKTLDKSLCVHIHCSCFIKKCDFFFRQVWVVAAHDVIDNRENDGWWILRDRQKFDQRVYDKKSASIMKTHDNFD